MKKILFFLITLSTFTFFHILNVNASTTNFYEGEYINGIYMNKRAAGSNTIYYQKARFFRQSGTNTAAYCIEPFNFFNESSVYQSTLTPQNLSSYQKERILKIAHFGYGYPGRTDAKWYAITQMMIWKTAEPNADFYFTDNLNGNRINAYTTEINQINNSITNYDTAPSIANKEYDLVEGESLDIIDSNNIINSYSTTNSLFHIDGNKLKTDSLKEGTYETDIIRKSNIHNTPVIFYQSSNSQDLVTMGDITNKSYHIRVNVIKTKIGITKIDSQTETTIPSGEGKLEGAKYQVYDSNKNEVATIEIDEDAKGTIENLTFGKYYLKEIEAGIGYTLDDTIYEFELSKENNNIELTLENKVIEAKIEINKQYGDNILNNEANISFAIFNQNNELIKTIITDEFGHAELTLPYGKYIVKQINSTKGYHKVEDFEINIATDETQTFNLTDLKIKVPNTRTNNNTLYKLLRILLLVCLKEFV